MLDMGIKRRPIRCTFPMPITVTTGSQHFP